MKVIVYSAMPEDLIESLREHFEIKHIPDCHTYTDLLPDLKEAEGLLGSGLRVDSGLLDHAPNLKIVSNISVGYDNLDIPELTKRGIMATNTPGVLDDTTADTIFGMMLAAARRFTELDRFVKEGRWKAPVSQAEYGIDVHHKTLGIIGMGRIGGKIAKRAHFGFDMNILYHNRSRNMEAENRYGATYCGLDELLQKSDFVCLMTPLTPETRHLIGEREFRLMKKTAVFVNGSRGQTVDEAALIRALERKTIYAAGMDVFEQEPVSPDNPLLKMENVVTLPHIGSATHETRYAMAKLAVENLTKGLLGQCPPSLINREIFQI
ncbi:bifunctional glyoxylate/hydroxypyruvate reductase B [Weizmannia acidilactici]|uniref:Glyoxylate/hydroxypyruvate reductase B n=1 Tax=Weizmannia acidilactici TaxID=2607726 RepID=A0A5J4JKY0_9BACI|nr:D-glycerate dehydrogenase [Weizmannia acidilactici]GER68262.1 bifunctional glyoxylate/hydroxypyruvate reductase B [Weizmannia acidilactici]GER69644.1 bifunctional glyoxylate/hydroxypyruvate reductase B [Weizmannia acidilactici]GER72535.1 bifunctional glyoxylate/hydroxypyruvate reductase B [Weizmannia acidilactici]